MAKCFVCKQESENLFPADPGTNICQECMEISDILQDVYEDEYKLWKESNHGKTKKY